MPYQVRLPLSPYPCPTKTRKQGTGTLSSGGSWNKQWPFLETEFSQPGILKKNRVIPAIKPWTVRKCVFVQMSEGEGWGPGKQKSKGSLPRVWSMSEPLCTSNPQIVGLSELFLKQEEVKGQFVGVNSLPWPCQQVQVVVARFFRLGCRDLHPLCHLTHPPT